MLVTAAWSAPSRPAPTVLRELDRRLRREGADVLSLRLDDPSDEELDAWSIDALPTWLRFEPAPDEADAEGSSGPVDRAGAADTTAAVDRTVTANRTSTAENTAGASCAVLGAVAAQRLVPADSDVPVARPADAPPSAEDQGLAVPARSEAGQGGHLMDRAELRRFREVRRLRGAAPKHEVAGALYRR